MTFDPTHYQLERYVDPGAAAPLRRVYYGLRPFLPRSVQVRVRRLYSHRQRRRQFPAWPIEPLLVEHQRGELLALARRHGAEGAPVTGFWPHGRRWAFVLTHDVESPLGIGLMPTVLELERRLGVVSSWNFCAEQYPIPEGTFEQVRAAGCEVGLHGLDHRGKMFASRQRFLDALPRIRHYLEAWEAVGFRSPALHRHADWMPEIGCLYDSSFPDTDPFEPFPGGCCSILPFLNRGLVELPVTLAQDHTLFEILRHRGIDVWVDKASWIMAQGGLVNVIVHPDYLTSAERLGHYEGLIRFLLEGEAGWHALPREVAAWWKDREERGMEADGATQWRARDVDGELVLGP